MKHLILIASLVLTVLLTAACVRTEEFSQRVAEELPEEVNRVQTALDEYMKTTQVLPIKPPQGRSLYQKYIIDFSKLESQLSEPPANSFENGGHFVFVIADPGKKPEVRVMDLRVTEEVGKLQTRVDAHKREEGKLPKGAREGADLYALDFKVLGVDPVTIPSPYNSQVSLPILIDNQGQLFVDYRVDVVQVLEEKKGEPDKDQDLRELLWKDSLFVPAYSPPMTYKKGDPVFKKK
ncbi:hypothetical protein [Salinithrix halophila]|uniref:Lipoprotein n=1 Tax=Salinithrix halophila TaxID=1485204 RepID=A0ABV8JLN5_9BACL